MTKPLPEELMAKAREYRLSEWLAETDDRYLDIDYMLEHCIRLGMAYAFGRSAEIAYHMVEDGTTPGQVDAALTARAKDLLDE